jgi:Ca-activated chloride channel homolog
VNLRFEEPVWIWLLAVLVPLAVVGAAWFSAMSPARRLSALLARVGLYALLIAILAGAARVQKTDHLAVVALVDISGSVRRYGGALTTGTPEDQAGAPGALNAAREWWRRATLHRGPDDLVGLVVFDGKSAALAVPSRIGGDPGLDVRLAEGTNIAEAIRLGRALIPPDATGRLVLLSDGNQTAGDALAAAGEVGGPIAGVASGASAPIDVVPLNYKLDQEVVLESVDAPPAAAAGATVNLRIVLSATAPSQGTLQVMRENTPIDLNGDASGNGRHISLKPGLNVQVVEVKLETGRVHRFRAIYEPDVIKAADGTTRLSGDTTTENNRGESFTITPGKGSVFIADGVGGGDESGPGAILAKALRASDIDVTMGSPEAVPADLLSLESYDVVILQNVPAESVPPRVQDQLVAYVRDLGGGLVMIGGPDSFGAGGWRGGSIEPILPVKLDIPDKLLTPEVAIVFVLDNSGSMGRPVMGSAKTQQQIANEATAMAIRTLDRRDLVGVVVFNSETDVLWPLSPNSDPKKLTEEVESISAGGGTWMGPALEEARKQLSAVDAKIKHVVVLSDGKSRGMEDLVPLTAKMNDQGIKISTIAVGDDADLTTMSKMAERGQGAYYHAINATMLPKIFLKAVRLVRTPLIREQPFDPVVLQTGSPMVAGLGPPPPLDGLVLTQARTEPTIVNAMMSPTGEPLLAHWNVGLGQVVAFTSDAHNWAKPWLDWPGYAKLWTQMVRTVSRPPSSRNFQSSTRVESGAIRLHLEATGDDGKPMEGLDVPATVYGPTGEARQVRLTQIGPGAYETLVDAPESGTYVSVIKPAAGQRRLTPVISGSTILEGAEYRAKQSNDRLLAEIAQRSGGRVLSLAAPERADLFDRTDIKPREAVTPMWRLLLVWALGVFMLDIATRRVAWDRWVSRRFRPELEGELAAEKARGAVAQRALGGLKARLEPDTVRERLSTPAALNEQDARNLALAAKDRRRAQRLANLSSPAAAPPAPSTPKSPDTKPAESSLLAAKRRAAERFQDGES